MVCNIYENDLTLVGQVGEFISLRWQERYNDFGTFQIVVNKTPEMLKIFKVGRFAGITGADTLAIIASVDDRNQKITVYGFEAKYILKDRIYDGIVNCRSKIELKLRDIVMEKRPYPCVALGTLNNLSATARTQRSYKSLFDISAAWCDLAEYGFRLRHDKSNKKLLYEVYQGSERKNLKFSEKYGNIYGVIRTRSDQEYKNIA